MVCGFFLVIVLVEVIGFRSLELRLEILGVL